MGLDTPLRMVPIRIIGLLIKYDKNIVKKKV